MKEPISIRRIPAPYKAMLAICSDLDETPDKDVYFEISKYLNTTQLTSMGTGVGLEVGNTIYFDMPPNQFSYWNTDDQGRARVRELIRAGYIDCLHSYGDLATTRNNVERALSELVYHNCQLKVWIDHAQVPTNFGGDIMCGYGDVLGADAYHADITTAYGIEYVWRGRVTSVIGQNIPKNLHGIVNWAHPLDSGKTLAKEVFKGLLAKAGSEKYAMHAGNAILRKISLRSGQNVREFFRANPFWGGVGLSATASGLASVLTREMLECLMAREGVSVLYTHLGKIKNRTELFPAKTISALEVLAQYSRGRKILVTTTKRLLDYCTMIDRVKYVARNVKDKIVINVEWGGDIRELGGLTFQGDIKCAEIHVNGTRLGHLRNAQLFKFREGDCLGLQWDRLEYPTD